MQDMQSTLLAGTSDDVLRKIIYDRVISKLTIFLRKVLRVYEYIQVQD